MSRKGPSCVAELAVTFILALSKDLLIAHRSVAEGAYKFRGLVPVSTSQTAMAFRWMEHVTLDEVKGRTLGIVGMGEIGCELAKRAGVLGMHIVYYKRHRLPFELEADLSVEYVSFLELLSTSDYVCLAVPHTSDTEGLIGPAEFGAMRSTAYLINVCRGGVVDEAALIDALKTRRIRGAALDVFRLEPLPADSELCRLDNVILTPHIGGGTGSSRVTELRDTIQACSRALARSPN